MLHCSGRQRPKGPFTIFSRLGPSTPSPRPQSSNISLLTLFRSDAGLIKTILSICFCSSCSLPIQRSTALPPFTPYIQFHSLAHIPAQARNRASNDPPPSPCQRLATQRHKV